MVDCYDADPGRLHDINRIYRFLDTLPVLIGMEKIGPPQLAVFDDPALAGITGIVMIVTSHISIHTYSNKDCFFLDVFSCKPFPVDVVLRHAEEYFRMQRFEKYEVERGREFPAENLHA